MANLKPWLISIEIIIFSHMVVKFSTLSNTTLSIIFENTCKRQIGPYWTRLMFEIYFFNGLNFVILQSLRKILAKTTMLQRVAIGFDIIATRCYKNLPDILSICVALDVSIVFRISKALSLMVQVHPNSSIILIVTKLFVKSGN